MSDSEIAIAITDVSRMFKRYRHPGYRVMEAFGLPLPKNVYDEFWALRGISLELRRGESLGLIGQNGAGKSTLLNIVCGRLRPSTGTVTVRGTIQALMDIGTGFHPEFTGRENIFSALAYQGITGRAAKAEFDDIVEFSELAEFIEQPVKTYSTGMYARLAFSTATAITPDVLIIDEVLGAGDAYFSAKCAERMRRITREAGATVLFVSHDIAAVQRMCSRAIWMDRGQIRMEGDTLDISKSYYADVTAREEARLRAQTTLAIARMRRRDGDTPEEGAARSLLFRLVAASGEMPRASHPIRRIALLTTDGRRVEVHPGAPMDNDGTQTAYIATDPEFVLWSRPQTIAGEIVRCFEDTGGSDRQAPIWFQNPAEAGWIAESIEIEHAAVAGDPVALEVYEPGGYRRLGLLTAHDRLRGWRTETLAIAAENPAEPAVPETGPRDKWDSDEAHFTEIDACNVATAAPQHVFGPGEPIMFRIVVELLAPVPQCWLACIVFDALGNRVSLLVNGIEKGLECGQSEILLRVDAPNLRQGEYVISIELLPEFDYDWNGSGRLPYLCHWDRCVYFKVDENYHGTISQGLVILSSTATAGRRGHAEMPESAPAAIAADPAEAREETPLAATIDLEATADPVAVETAASPLGTMFDSVYFFMWPGWRTELEANRWHWGKRWAQRLPTVFIQPELAERVTARAVPEPRLENVELLSIEMPYRNTRDWLAVALRQAGQIAAHMAARGHERPLFWFYNPQLTAPFALAPARARVFHATENYFDFPGVDEEWLNYCRYAIEASDLVVCCSSGVAAGLARDTRGGDFLTLPNGCDFGKYSQPAAAQGDWPARLDDWRKAERRLAVFAGNINSRLDFDLIEALAARYPEIGFVFAGPVDSVNFSSPQRSAWERLQQAANVRALGRVPPEDLPALYWSCDIGIIPYRTDLPMVVENGFPLKALEMAAAGLPVVASLMKPLHEVADAVTVAPDTEAFSAAVATHSRRSRSQAQGAAADRVCRAHDYDLLFERMIAALAPRIGDGPSRPANLVGLTERIGSDNYRDSLAGLAAMSQTFGRRSRIPVRYHLGTLLSMIPLRIRQIVPEPIKRLGRRCLS